MLFTVGSSKQDEMRSSISGKTKRLLGEMKAFSALLLLAVVFTVMNDRFLSVHNLMTMLNQSTNICLLAFAETFVILTGGIDLSVGSILAISCVTVGKLMVIGLPVPVAIVLAILTGAFFGFINGFVVSKMKIVPFIATLGMQSIARGLTYILTESMPISGLPESFSTLGGGTLGFVPLPVLYMIGLGFVFTFLLNKSAFGRRVYAIGSNRESARLSGISVEKTEMAVFTLAGLLAGFVGVIMTSRVLSSQPNSGIGYESDAIAAAIIGGASLNGGKGTILGAIIGALTIAILKNGLNLNQVNSFWQQVAIGIVIIVAVYIDERRKIIGINGKKQKRNRRESNENI